ncbi:MAG: hypothetical protein LIO37_01085 [Clostridiales bacterium]|nr:hypothetical protein [Clostridiales bacterium]
MFCQKAIIFATMVCFIIIWGGLVVVAQSDMLSDLIQNGFRNGLLLTGNAEGIVRAVMLIVTAVLVLLLLKAAFRHFNRVSRRRLYIYSAVMLAVMIAIYVFFLTQLRIVPTNDARTVADLAYTIAKTGMQSLDADNVYANYFSKYGNNYAVVFYLAGFFKLTLAVGITDIWMPLYLLNMSGLLLGAAFTWLTAGKVLGLKGAVKVQLLMTLCPVYYLMMFWVYTTTLSVPFVMGMIYLALCIRDVAAGELRITAGLAEAAAGDGIEETGAVAASGEKGVRAEEFDRGGKTDRIIRIKLIVLSAVAGLVCSLGFLLRATNAIVAIAIAICMLLSVMRRIASRKSQQPYGRTFIVGWIAACLVAAIVAVSSYGAINSACQEFFAEVSDNNYPITHWLMMGSHGNAMYNSEDSEFTNSFETAEEKTEATWAQTVENYKEAGVAGTLKLIVKKMIINWSDGYFAMDIRLEQSMKYSPVYTYIAGNHNDVFHLYCQGYWLAIGVLVIAACIRTLRKETVPMLPFLLVLTLFGAIVFYWFWEVKPAYALPFLYVFYLLAVCGQEAGACGEDKTIQKTGDMAAAASVSEADELIYHAGAGVCDKEGKDIDAPAIGRKSGSRFCRIGYVIVVFLAVEYLYNNIIDSNIEYYDYSIRCTQKGWLKQVAKEDGDTVTQEFYPGAAFNRIVLSVAAGKDSGQSGMQSGSDSSGSGSESGETESGTDISSGGKATCLYVTLEDSEGNVVYKGMITEEDISSDNMVTLDVGEQSADTQGGYLLSITKVMGSFGNINIRTRKGISLDAYKGELYINGVLQGTDLYMQVYMYRNT